MGRARDAERTREAILEAATEEFAERGYAGARVDGIANRAGANKQLVYRYFGTKAELYRTVSGKILAERAATLETSPASPCEYRRHAFPLTV